MNKELILKELQFKAVRSGGAGGQHVNKVSSKVELTFAIENSEALTPNEKERLISKLGSRLTKENVLMLSVDESRSQHKNKVLVLQKLFELLEKALIVRKKRLKTKPSKSAIEKRLQSKKKAALKKANRGKSHLE